MNRTKKMWKWWNHLLQIKSAQELTGEVIATKRLRESIGVTKKEMEGQFSHIVVIGKE